MPVVVEVRHGDANVIAGAGKSGGIGYVCEHSVAIVAEQPIPILGSILFQRGDIRAVREENVRTAIAVVVEDRHSSGHGFRSVAGGCLGIFQAKGNLLQLKRNWTL